MCFNAFSLRATRHNIPHRPAPRKQKNNPKQNTMNTNDEIEKDGLRFTIRKTAAGLFEPHVSFIGSAGVRIGNVLGNFRTREAALAAIAED